MSTSQLRDRIAALRAEAAAVGAELAARGAGMGQEELFEVTGELQGVANAVEGAQLVAIAHAGSHELRLTERGPVEIHHEVGFIDAMTSSEVSLATGLGQWAAGRKVGLAEALAGRFTKLLGKVLTGELATVNAGKVVTACDGLDARACAAVEDVLVQRLVGMDPARITTVARKVATRIAADQVAAATAKNKKDRAVQVTPGPDGTTDWWARLPAGRSAAAWAAIRDLADRYTKKDPTLTLDQARADAFIDLLLTNVTVTAKVTLGIPVITGPDAEHARAAALAEHAAESPTSDGPSGASAEAETADERARVAATGEVPSTPRKGPPSPCDAVRTDHARAGARGCGRRSPPAASAWARGSPCPRPCCPAARSPASASSTPTPCKPCSPWSPPTSAAPCSTPTPAP